MNSFYIKHNNTKKKESLISLDKLNLINYGNELNIKINSNIECVDNMFNTTVEKKCNPSERKDNLGK